VSLPLMRSLVSDENLDVRTTALFHLARRGDVSDVPTLVEHLAGLRTSEPAIEGIERLGTAATFSLLRPRLEAVPVESRTDVTRALQRLTFAPIWRGPSEWDAWWKTHSSSTREDWAREALRNADNLAPLALRYLSRTGNATTETVDAAMVSRNVYVRLEAARLVGESDPRRAVLLLARELDNRSVVACGQAVAGFNSLLARSEQVDCTSFSERTTAQVRWRAWATR
jgi:HEAT repeat protein